MRGSVFIRKTIAVFLLAVFALCNTPTRYLHRIFANHTDYTAKTWNHTGQPQLDVTGISCHCESNVVMAPYTFTTAPSISVPVRFLHREYRPVITGKFSASLYFIGLRGPPYAV